jgi:hypothetical protein
MPTPTYDLIASNVLATTATSVTFSSIPSTYRDLVVVADTINTTTGFYLVMRVNGNTTASNYSAVQMIGNGSTASSASQSGTFSFFFANVNASSTRILTQVQLLDYSATDKHKSILMRTSVPGAEVEASANRFAQTGAITSLTFREELGSKTFAAGSSFYLYGIVS